MKKIVAALALAGLCTSTLASARTKDLSIHNYALPADKPVTVVLMRPDVQVGQLNAGGTTEPNADWTTAARDHLQSALANRHKARGIEFKLLDPSQGDSAQLVADYEALHRAVATSIVEFAYGAKLPTKKARKDQRYKFDWTLGDGTQRLAEVSGGNYALFLHTRDNFATAGRKAMQAAGMLGCLVGFCTIVSGGQHIAYASLVELSTGNIVWFNILRGSDGDVREAAGAQSMVDSITATMPTKPGQGVVTVTK